MQKDDLVELLKSIAEKDTNEGHDVYDHPCSVAIRAIDKCFDDINSLRKVEPKDCQFSKKMTTLVKLEYNPSW
jgi:hypothetical protein